MKTRKVTKVWTRKNGKKVRICDMNDYHLNNAIKMIDRARDDNLKAVGDHLYEDLNVEKNRRED